jgi:IS4 transposase
MKKTSASEIRLLTNHLELAATTIGAIYKERWQIELFFKTLKQNLKIKTFVGPSPNAAYSDLGSINRHLAGQSSGQE